MDKVAQGMPKQQPKAKPESKADIAEAKAIRDAFHFFDTDGSGAIDVREMHEAMKALGFKCTLADAQDLIAQYDDDGTGTVDLFEFEDLVKSKRTEQATGKRGDGDRVLHQGALKNDRNHISFIMDARVRKRKRARSRLLKENEATLARRMNELNEEQSWELARRSQERRQERMKYRVHPSKQSVDIQTCLRKAVKAGDFDLKDVLSRQLDDQLVRDDQRQRASALSSAKLRDDSIIMSHTLAKQRATERIKVRQAEALRAVEKADRELEFRAACLQEGTKRRHDRVCRMLCGQAPDCGLERMRSFGARFRAKAKGCSERLEIPSLTKSHVFSKEEERESRKVIAAQTRERQRLARAQYATRSSTPQKGDFTRTQSLISPGRTQTLNFGRSKTSMK